MYVKEKVYARVSAHHGETLYVRVPPYEFCSTAIRTDTTHRSTTTQIPPHLSERLYVQGQRQGPARFGETLYLQGLRLIIKILKLQ